jgi:autotransporter-associated beta strand protein
VNSDFVCIGVHSWLCLLCFLCCLLLISPSLRAQSLSGNDLNSSISSNGLGKGGKHGHKPKPTPAPVSGGNPRPTGVDGESDWNNAGGTTWSTTGNWTGVGGGTAPPSSADVAWFKTAFSSGQPNLTASTSIVGLYFGDKAGGTTSSGYDITSSSTSVTLTLTGTATTTGGTETSNSGAAAIGADNTSGTNTIDAPIILAPSTGTVSTIYQEAGGTLILIGEVSGSGINLTKTGGGTLSLTSNSNTYSGGTTVDAGRLLADNTTDTTSATGSGAVTVNSGGTLGGTGFINAGSNTITVNSGGTLLGGDGSAASGSLTLKSAVSMQTGSIISLALGSSLTHSVIAMSSATLNFATNQDFKFIELAGVTTGTYSGIITGIASQPSNIGTWKIDNAGWVGSFSWDDSNGGEINVNFTVVPEPSTYFAAALALAVVGYTLRKRIGRVLKRA